ncbi:cell wall metabolism sensor histidine kinase WalK [Geodermatophilus sp. DSM 44513]|uniref:sensor histidine kinase n=1 Tax=Geodermatophilus sp. DSM 44513 TaxID=1528104 RepID=UPI001276A93C|nr:HAMP domain-containing sensor histidine kinase [Geodermatophilus sp. DSM 44513]WNV76018.1 HAMP domain-containing sensor histidine kinase [Geodermatophilus sp. DSM 44513]
MAATVLQDGGRPGRPPFSARGRIVGWMLGLLGLALLGSVLVAWEALGVRADRVAQQEVEHEVAKFAAFTSSDVAGDYTQVDRLLDRYLDDTLPNGYEAYFSVVDGRFDERNLGAPVRLDEDPAFAARVREVTDGTVVGSTGSAAGEVHYAVVPVRVDGDPRPAQLVLVAFRDAINAPFDRAVQVFALVSGVALVLAALASWLVAGRVLAPIRLVRRTAETITAGDLRQRIRVSGRDDVAALAATFNRMLDRLEHSFAAQRRFLDDAGHELRTPLTVLRGHLEVPDDDPARQAHTRALLLDEVRRMQRIVDDLLVLAKTETPDFLIPAPVDLADLTIDVLEKARPLGVRRWAVDSVADAVVEADGQRLTQALVQLISNAVEHTTDGDRIGVGSRVDADAVRLWVADTGPGVPPEDRARIFERFVRADRGVRREGAGLGLAIVRSIARAHGGEVTVGSAPSGGALFVLHLPLSLLRRCGAEDPEDLTEVDGAILLPRPAAVGSPPGGPG